MDHVSVSLPDGSIIRTIMDEQSTIADLLKVILANNGDCLKQKANIVTLTYSEWRLTMSPRIPPDGVWNRSTLASLYKPIEGRSTLQQYQGDHQQKPMLTLIHVLSTIPVQLTNIPNATPWCVSFPVLSSMTPETFIGRVRDILQMPETSSNGDPIRYSAVLSPTEQHHTLATVQRMKYSSNVPTLSWLAGTIKRPVSVVGSWLRSETERDLEAPNSPLAKTRISLPLIPSPDDDNVSTAENASASQSLSTTSGSEDNTDQTRLDALLENLQIPYHRRQSFYNLAPEKRATLLAQSQHARVETSPVCISPRKSQVFKDSLNLVMLPEPSPKISLPACSFKRRSYSPVISNYTQSQRSRQRRTYTTSNVTSSENSAKTLRARSKSPIRLDMSKCPPKLEWKRPKSPIRAQSTGSSWLSTWWHKSEPTGLENSATYFLQCLRKKNLAAEDALELLHQLRIHLEIAQVSWLDLFLEEEGPQLLVDVSISQEYDKSEVRSTIEFEYLRCVRILLNNENGFQCIMNTVKAISHTGYIARCGDLRSQTTAADILAGICTIGPIRACRKVFQSLAYTSDNRSGRLDWLVETLTDAKPISSETATSTLELQSLIRARLSLCNCLIDATPMIEDRIALRFELFGDLQKFNFKPFCVSEDIIIQHDLLLERSIQDEDSLMLYLLSHDHSETGYSTGTSVLAKEQILQRLFSLRNKIEDCLHCPYADTTSSSVRPDFESSHYSGIQSSTLHLDISARLSMVEAAVERLKLILNARPENFSQYTLSVHRSTPSVQSHLLTAIRSEENVMENMENVCTDRVVESSKSCVTQEVLEDYSFNDSRSVEKPTSSNLCFNHRCETIENTSLHYTHKTDAGTGHCKSIVPTGKAQKDELPSLRKQHTLTPLCSRLLEGVASANDNTTLQPPTKDLESCNKSVPLVPVLLARAVQKGCLASRCAPVDVLPDADKSSMDFLLPQIGPPPPPPPPLPVPRSAQAQTLSRLRGVPPLAPTLSATKVPQSREKLKPLYWDKLSFNHIQDTVWVEVSKRVDNALHQEMMLSDLERYFVKEDGMSMVSTNLLKNHKSPNYIRKISLIDNQRAKSIEVMLARHKLSPPEILQSLLFMDDGKLGSIDQLRIMERNAPTDDEIALIQDYQGNFELLGNAERYIGTVRVIPRLARRISALIFRRRFDMDVFDSETDLNTLKIACSEILECDILKDFLALVLSAGNILNASTFRGNALGFRIESLMKVLEVKSSARSRCGASLLHYLVAVINREKDFTTAIAQNLKHCATAARICSRRVIEEALALATGIIDIQDEIRVLESGNLVRHDDRFVIEMTGFLERVEHTATQLKLNALAAQHSANSLLKYFGEDIENGHVEDIFTVLHNLLNVLAKVEEENMSLSGSNFLRARKSLHNVSLRSSSHSFDGTLRAMRNSQHSREVSREVRDRPSSRVFPPPFR